MLHILHPPTYLPERHYTHEVLLRSFLCVDCSSGIHGHREVRIELPGDETGRALILPDNLFQTPETRWLTPASLPRRPLAQWDIPDALAQASVVSRRIPILFGLEGEGARFYHEDERGVTLGVDIFGSAFFMLTRYEELANPLCDSHGRFPAHASLAWQEGFLERPLVNEYLEILWAALKRLWPRLQRRQRSHRVFLSHDVDEVFCVAGRGPLAVLRSALADVARRRDPLLVHDRVRAYVQVRRGRLDSDLANTFDFIMDTSERHGLQSAFYFLADCSPRSTDATYSLDHPWVRTLVRRIGERGHEIGLHGSYDSPADPLRIRFEFQTLQRVAVEENIRQAAWGGRHHYLRWRNPITWRGWAAAGLDYDGTLAYADYAGFRCGVCYEYPVFDLLMRRTLRLRERPLIVMEVTLLENMHLDWASACRRIVELNATCKTFAGDFTLLWHNSTLISKNQRHWYNTTLASL